MSVGQLVNRRLLPCPWVPLSCDSHRLEHTRPPGRDTVLWAGQQAFTEHLLCARPCMGARGRVAGHSLSWRSSRPGGLGGPR